MGGQTGPARTVAEAAATDLVDVGTSLCLPGSTCKFKWSRFAVGEIEEVAFLEDEALAIVVSLNDSALSAREGDEHELYLVQNKFVTILVNVYMLTSIVK